MNPLGWRWARCEQESSREQRGMQLDSRLKPAPIRGYRTACLTYETGLRRRE